jgi:hypothetical protein
MILSGDLPRSRILSVALLLAGVSDKKKASATLPDLSRVLAYPTSVFIGRDGRVRKIYSGFAGPGTGAHYDKLRTEIETEIGTLLAEERGPLVRSRRTSTSGDLSGA